MAALKLAESQVEVDENGVLFHRLNIEPNDNVHVPALFAQIFLSIMVRLSVQSLIIHNILLIIYSHSFLSPYISNSVNVVLLINDLLINLAPFSPISFSILTHHGCISRNEI